MLRIKELRESKGITQKDLGEALGISQNTLSQYENNKREPDYETLKKIAEYFSVSTDYLLSYNSGASTPPEGHLEKEIAKHNGKYSDLNIDSLIVGLSREKEGLLTDEDKEQIIDFVEFLANKRKKDMEDK